jgi:hypothetical protein
MDLRDTLLDLVVRHGVNTVKTELDSICKSLYEELVGLYGEEQKESKKEKKVETRGRKKRSETKVEEQPQEQIQEQLQEEPEPEVETESEREPEPEPIRKRIVKKQQQNIVVEKVEEHGGIDKEDMNLLDPKEQQRIAVEKKHDELLANGTDPESLLTKENLEKWIKGGKSYQKIARDHVGLHESIVSAKAKEFGLQSLASKYKFIRKK